jgi:hypothetical protein
MDNRQRHASFALPVWTIARIGRWLTFPVMFGVIGILVLLKGNAVLVRNDWSLGCARKLRLWVCRSCAIFRNSLFHDSSYYKGLL